MTDLADLHLKPAFLARWGLPAMPYPVPVTALKFALEQGEDLSLDLLLHGLQQRSSQATADWQRYEPAMDRLAQLLAPEDVREVVTVVGDDWWLEIGPVALDEELIAIERGDGVIAAIAPRPDGRLRVAGYRPLDAKSADLLMSLGRNPDDAGSVCMRETNWAYVCDCAASMGNTYAAQRCSASLLYWAKGIASMSCAAGQSRRSGAIVTTEIGVRYTHTMDIAVEY